MARSPASTALALLFLLHLAVAFVVVPPLNKAFAKASTVVREASTRDAMDRRGQVERVALIGLGIVLAPSLPALADRCG